MKGSSSESRIFFFPGPIPATLFSNQKVQDLKGGGGSREGQPYQQIHGKYFSLLTFSINSILASVCLEVYTEYMYHLVACMDHSRWQIHM